MAQSLIDIPVGSTEYSSVNTLAGVAIGDAMVVLNKGSSWINLVESETQPDVDTTAGVNVSTMGGNYAEASITTNSLEIWAKATTGESLLSVQ